MKEFVDLLVELEPQLKNTILTDTSIYSASS